MAVGAVLQEREKVEGSLGRGRRREGEIRGWKEGGKAEGKEGGKDG